MRLHGPAKIVFVTAFRSFDSAVGALKAGVHDYLCKPSNSITWLRRCGAASSGSIWKRVERFESYRRAYDRADTMLMGTAGLAPVREVIERASEAEFPVLVTGETGTGKNLVAKAIPHGGSRREVPFVHLNCAAPPESLIEAELFGWDRGGVHRRRGDAGGRLRGGGGMNNLPRRDRGGPASPSGEAARGP